MNKNNFVRKIHLDDYSAMPKYLQLSNSILSAVDSGDLNKGDLMPSLNDICSQLNISRGTVEKGYRYLMKIKAVASYRGKGYYIADRDYCITKKVCLLFNKLSAHKKIIYESFVGKLGNKAKVDFFVYNNSSSHFRQILDNNQNNYTHYVIIPHFLDGEELAGDIISAIPREKLILLDKKVSGINGAFGAVFENFERDIYRVFTEAKEHLLKYNTLTIIFPENSYYPKEIINGFILFCRQHEFNYNVIDNIQSEEIKRGTLYVSVMEDDLVDLLEKIVESGLVLGKEVGVISYNETALKKMILNGITTISTDFSLLGSLAAELVLDDSKRQIEVPFNLTLRSST